MQKRHSYDYGIIGNCAFTAHIGLDTNIAWMCWPRFDSSFIFGSMLDKEKGGSFSILPSGTKWSSDQFYIDNTNVLCTDINTDSGSYRVTDFTPRFFQMDRYYRPLMLIRKIERIEGTPTVVVRCRPKGDYGNITPEPSFGSNHIRFLGLDSHVRLTTNISLNHVMNEESFVLNETKYLVMTWGPPLEAALQETCENFLSKTVNYWQNWIKSANIAFSEASTIAS